MKKNQKKYLKYLLILLSFLLCTCFIPQPTHAAAGGVVVIDPGHNGEDTGAIACDGTPEKQINAELSYKVGKTLQNRGCQVYLSHSIEEDEGVPQDLPYILPYQWEKYSISGQLVPAIASVNPDLALCIHHNSSTSQNANGFEAYYRTDHNSDDIIDKESDLASSVTDACANLGWIDTHGSPIKDSMFLICRSEVPTTLFEAGFISNPEEFQNLKDDAKQWDMANHIADGVENYFKLHPGSRQPDVDATYQTVTVAQENQNNGRFTVIAYNVQSEHGIAGVKFPTFLPNSSEAIWLDGHYIGNNAWACSYDTSGFPPGTYTVHVYAQDDWGHLTALQAVTANVPPGAETAKENVALDTFTTEIQDSFTTIVENVPHSDPSATHVQFPIFAPGATGAAWYDAHYIGFNTWAISHKISEFGNATGKYITDVYVNSLQTARTSIIVEGITADNVRIQELGSGSFQITVDNVTSPAPLTKVLLPVCTKEDYSDAKWYTAQLNGYNQWVAYGDIRDFNDATRNYKATALIGDARGVETLFQNLITTQMITNFFQQPTVNFQPTTDESWMVLTATNLDPNAQQVLLPTWSDSKAQADIHWYEAQRETPTVWRAYFYLPEDYPNTYGLFHTHVYQTIAGISSNVCAEEFTIHPPAVQSASAEVNQQSGSFAINIQNVTGPAPIASVDVAVWQAGDQSDLQWYRAQPSGGSDYTVKGNIQNHNYHTGEYQVHIYVTDSRGIQAFGTLTSFQIPSIAISDINIEQTNEDTLFVSAHITPVANTSITETKMPVYTEKEGIEHVVWHDADYNASTQTLTALIPLTEHQHQIGLYYINPFVKDSRLTSFYVTQEYRVGQASNIHTNPTSDAFGQEIYANYQLQANEDHLVVGVYTNPNDIYANYHIYDMQNIHDSQYKATMKIPDLTYTDGTYYAWIWSAQKENLVQPISVPFTFTVEKPTASNIDVYVNQKSASFDLQINQTHAPAKIVSVKFAVWQAADQSDIVWYAAQLSQIQDQWKASGDIRRHQGHTGVYTTHAYIEDERGVFTCAATSSFTIESSSMENLMITNHGVSEPFDTSFSITAVNVTSPGNITEVTFGVYCSPDLSDLYWYPATQQSQNTWVATGNIANHQYHTGTYTVHAFIKDSRGEDRDIFQSTGSIIPPTSDPEIRITPSADESTFDATLIGADPAASQIIFSVYSEASGEKNSIVSYPGVKISNEIWKTQIITGKHGGQPGTYHCIAYQTSHGYTKPLKSTTFQVTPPSAASVAFTDLKGNGDYSVQITNPYSPAQIQQINVAVWSQPDGSDMVWYAAADQGNGIFKATGNIANNQYHFENYVTNVYIKDARGISYMVGEDHALIAPNPDTPTFYIKPNADESQYTATLYGADKNASKMQFPTFSESGGPEQAFWYDAARLNQTTWQANIIISNHQGAAGNFTVVAWQTLNAAGSEIARQSFYVDPPHVDHLDIAPNGEAGQYIVTLSGVTSTAPVTNVKAAVWPETTGQSCIYWYYPSQIDNTTWQFLFDTKNHDDQSGSYFFHIYIADTRGVDTLSYMQTIDDISTLTPIIGATHTNVQQMVNYFYNQGGVYPSYYQTNGGAPTIEAFAQIFMEEAQAEGVKPEMAFCQSMKETGFLAFGGAVDISQFNFAGLGATDSGGTPASFPDVRTGVRAQIQHLKAYACTQPLNNPCVDPRFDLVTRNCAPYIEWLGIHENPYGKGWASAINYGYNIVDRMVTLLCS